MKTKLLREEHYAEEMSRVRRALDRIRVAGTFARKKDEKLWFELYPARNPRGWLAISTASPRAR